MFFLAFLNFIKVKPKFAGMQSIRANWTRKFAKYGQIWINFESPAQHLHTKAPIKNIFMESGDQNQPKPNTRKFRWVLPVLFAGVLVAAWFGWKSLLPRHPSFGAIHETQAADFDDWANHPIKAFLRDHLSKVIGRTSFYRKYLGRAPRYFELGGDELEWSIGGSQTGWIYFWGPEFNYNKANAPWEFARCKETNFMAVTNVPFVFHGFADPHLGEVFGGSSTTNAIPVWVGEILFVRKQGEPDCVYVLKLEKQDRNKLLVHYCVTKP